MKPLLPALLILFCGGCGTSPSNSEATRELVLQYVGRDVGTSGPFSKQARRELAALSSADRAAALVHMDRGAVGFLIIERSPAPTNRIVLIHKGRVVADYPAARD